MSVVKIIGFMLVLLASGKCSTETANNPVFEKHITGDETRTMNDRQTQKVAIENTSGIVTLNRENYRKDEFIHLYNQDGSLWYKFTYYYDDSDGKFEYRNEDFKPFAFHPDYFVLALRCVGENHSYYEVIVNEDTGMKKFVEKDGRTLKFEPWEKHILNTFAIGFSREENAIRETPGGKVKIVDLPKEVTFRPVEIKGEWLRVRWNGSKNSGKSAEFGWVKWKENHNILVELFYFS